MMAGNLKKTPLHGEHEALGGKMVAFAGFAMPVQYPTGIVAEHRAVREAAGLFDVSHMGEFEVTGPDALELVRAGACAVQVGTSNFDDPRSTARVRSARSRKGGRDRTAS